jgi:hypothetical protein
MPVSDSDVELLEAHLDGELSSQEDTALRSRLASDPDLSTELSALRAHREIRIELFESFEPDDQAVKNLVLGVRKQITRDAIRGDRIRILRYIASAAAVVLFSFSAGWLGKGKVATPAPSVQSVAQNTEAGSIDFSANSYPGQGIGTLVSNTLNSANAPAQPRGDYPVELIDSLGHVVAIQHFHTPQEAREFSQDVTSWQHQQQQMHSAVEPVVYKDQF